MILDIIVAIIAMLFYITFIFVTRRNNTFSSYSVAERKIGFWLLFASMSANYIGPGMTIGLADKGASTGYFTFAVAIFYGIGKMFEGHFFAPAIRKKFNNAYTLGDIIGGVNSHNSNIVRFIAGLISFGLVVGLTTVMAKAAGDILYAFLGVPKIIGTVIITTIVMGYSVFGGIKSSMQTDLIQFILFVALIPLLLLLSILNFGVTNEAFIQQSIDLSSSSFSSIKNIDLIALMVTWFFGEMLIPPTISTILSSQSVATSRKALVSSGLFMIAWLFIMLSLGVVANLTLESNSIGEATLLNIAAINYPPGLYGLFAVALVGVVMSSQDCLINGASVIFSQDLIHPIKQVPEEKRLFWSRISGIAVGVLAILFASFIPSVIESLLFFYSIWVPSILVVAIISIYGKKHKWYAAFGAMIFGISTSIIWNITVLHDSFPTIVAGILISGLSYLCLSIIPFKHFIGK
ncbi:MAG TPA: sodium:solute symporter family protein [Chitinophagales bacterium]|nr:sodium:solute symporter family protein [Chitinophagales bacterium]HRG85213.1 sodium:solute symporter family protein [Chitinophagales bacterium]HRH51809.1 sodium:solute symporter family protein [Chitinophagales bacterium]